MLARHCLVAVLGSCLLITAAAAQQASYPRHGLLAIYPAGAQAGNTVEVTITEQIDLDLAETLVFSHPGITAKPTMTEPDRFYPEPRPVPNQFQVTVAANVPPGTYEVRATGKYGVSNARRFVVSDLPEVVEVEPNNTLEQATKVAPGVVVNGKFGTDYDYFGFQAKKGQRLIVICAATQIDSRGDAVIAIYDAGGREILRSQDGVGLDPIIDFTAPADGDYAVLVHELTFTASGGATNSAPYRLMIADRPWVDYIDPPVVPQSTPTKVAIYGSNLGGEATKVNLGGRQLEKVEATISAPSDPRQWKLSPDLALPPIEASLDCFTYRHPTPRGLANPVRLAIADTALTDEQEPNETIENAPTLTLPATIIGHFSGSDRDGFIIEAKKDESFWIEIDSERLGQPTDPAFVVQRLTENNMGEWTAGDLKTADDQTSPIGGFRVPLQTRDPSLLFTAPNDGRFRILVWDQFGSGGGSDYPYRLVVRRPQPDFRMAAIPDLVIEQNHSVTYVLTNRAPTLRRGGCLEITLAAFRRDGFEGTIEVKAAGLPAGVTAEPTLIGPEQTSGMLLLRAAPDAKPWQGTIELTASALIGERQETREVKTIELLFPGLRTDPAAARLGDSLFVCLEDDLTHPAALETAQTTIRTVRGANLEIPVKLKKFDEEFKMASPVTILPLPVRTTRTDGNAPANGSEGKVELKLQGTVTPGEYSLYLRGEVDYGFSRNAEIAEQAKLDLERIKVVAQEIAEEYKQATQDRTKADQEMAKAAQAVSAALAQLNLKKQQHQQAEQASKLAEQQVTQMQAAFDAAAKAVVEADKAAKSAAEDGKAAAEQNLAQAKQAEAAAKTNLDNAKRDAEAKTKATAEAAAQVQAAEKEHAAAEEQSAAAKEARVKAGEEEMRLRDESTLATRTVSEANNVSVAATRAATSRNVKTPLYGPVIRLQVEAYPGVFTLNTAPIKVKAGEKAVIPISVKREFDWKDEVTFTFAPQGVSGWQFNNAKILANQDKTDLEVTIPANQAAGEFQAEFTARTRLNNFTLDETIAVQFVVEAAPAE